jgi:hypothetical protein
MLVRLAEGVVLTADKEEGLRAWNLKDKGLIAKHNLDGNTVPTCLAIDEQETENDGLGISVGFMNGGFGIWRLDIATKTFTQQHRHAPSSNGRLSAVAYAYPYLLTITDGQLLSLYTFTEKPPTPQVNRRLSSPISEGGHLLASSDLPGSQPPPKTSDTDPSTSVPFQPHLLASLKSHTSWPPLSLSIRTTTTTIIASIAYAIPTYLSGYTIGLQELHLSATDGAFTFSRLTSALSQGFQSILPPLPTPYFSASMLTRHSRSFSRPTSLSYSHPYILATHPDNTLTLYLCTSTASKLSISPGTKLWGHTSSVSDAEITPRGKAVSVSTRGNELRVWELEGGLSSSAKKRIRSAERSVQIRPGIESELDTDEEFGSDIEARKNWVGFDDEMVIVLKESTKGTQALMVYDFT